MKAEDQMFRANSENKFFYLVLRLVEIYIFYLFLYF